MPAIARESEREGVEAAIQMAKEEGFIVLGVMEAAKVEWGSARVSREPGRPERLRR